MPDFHLLKLQASPNASSVALHHLLRFMLCKHQGTLFRQPTSCPPSNLFFHFHPCQVNANPLTIGSVSKQ
jgi:hypothetical protein